MTKYTLPILLVISFLSGCNQNQKKSTESETELKSATINRSIELSMEENVFELSALPDTVEVKMTNNDVSRLTTGKLYYIEIFENNQWRTISPNIIFPDEGIELKPTEHQYFKKDLYKNWIPYQKGRYRIVKEYIKRDYPTTRKRYKLYVEFNIE